MKTKKQTSGKKPEKKPKQRVFVLIAGWDYEGYGAPPGVYSTKLKAEKARLDYGVSGDSVDILEYIIDGDSK